MVVAVAPRVLGRMPTYVPHASHTDIVISEPCTVTCTLHPAPCQTNVNSGLYLPFSPDGSVKAFGSKMID